MFFQGSFVALVTPFNNDHSIDKSALKALVRWHIEQGTDGIVCCGTTGEGISLSFDERLEVIKTCVKESNGSIPVIGATTTANTLESCKLTREAKEIGVDATLAVVPYYSRPTDKGVVLHFEKIAEEGLDMIVYENPLRTSKSLLLETFKRLESIPNVKAIKASVGRKNFQMIKDTTDIPLFAGDDFITYDLLQLGAVGAISVVGNIIPKEWKEMISLCLSNEFEKALLSFLRYKKLLGILVAETNPQIVKLALHLLGKIDLVYRLPLISPEKKHHESLFDELVDLNLCNQSTYFGI